MDAQYIGQCINDLRNLWLPNSSVYVEVPSHVIKKGKTVLPQKDIIQCRGYPRPVLPGIDWAGWMDGWMNRQKQTYSTCKRTGQLHKEIKD